MESLYKQNYRRLQVTILVLNLLMIMAAVFFLRESFFDYRRQAQTNAENLSLSLEQTITDTFKIADVLLASIADEYGLLSQEKTYLAKILISKTTQNKQLSSLLVIDAEGLTVFSKNEPTALKSKPPYKETIQQLKLEHANRMLVSQPLQDQISGEWFLLLARRINNPDGSFAGSVVTTLPMEFFQKKFGELRLGSKGSITFRDSNLRLIVRHPSLANGQQIGSSKISDDFRNALGKNPNLWVYDAGIASTDGIKRLHSYRHNSDYGFYINVGIAKDDFFAEWEGHLLQSAMMVTAFMLFSLVLTRILGKSWGKQLVEETKRIETEKELRKLSRVAEQSPVAIVITDLAGSIEYVNPKFIQVTGYTTNEVIGRNPSLLQSGETTGFVYEHLWQTILAGNVWEGDFCNRKKSGELFWEHSTISPLRNAEGQITHFIAIKEDITQKISVMEQLLQSQKMQSIGQLAGGIAHDFNNILSIINGYICLMQLETGKDHPLREYIDFIQQTSSRAGELTHALLAFSRKQIINPKLQNINTVLGNVKSLLERIIREDIAFRMFFADDPLYVNVDSTQIDYVLINFTTNAMDAMPGGGKFSITTSRRTMDAEFINSKKFGAPGDYAAVEISDNGIGMNNETIDHIFEPFYTTKDVGKGTGLGLAMAFGIIKQHNGFIEVSSKPGRGTTFTLFLPLLSNIDAEDDGVIPLDMSAFPHGDETILLAEDDQHLRIIMQKMLTSCGYTVIAAEDGQDAVDKFQTYVDKIDLLVFDLIMPRKNGREACSEIREQKIDMKVLFHSGYAADEISTIELQSKYSGYLAKPAHPSILMLKIREMLDS